MKIKTNFYILLTLSGWHIIKKYKEIIALVSGNKFYCLALQGEANSTLAISSDLTVSCNCTDIYGYGKIGDLKLQTMDEVLSGHKALTLKKRLAKGKLPMINCAQCVNLRMTKIKIDTNKYQMPESILLENTAICNLNCLSCHRKKVDKQRTEKKMSLQDIEHLAIMLRDIKIKEIHFFDLGEPFYSDNIKKEIEILKKYNPSALIYTSTNALLIDTQQKKEAALMFDHINFSIHGADQKSISKYMKNGNFEKAYNNMKELVKLRGNKKKPILKWKYVLFRWNDRPDLINKAIKLAKEAGVDIIYFCKTLSPLYGISYRYYLGFDYLRKIGKPVRKGREIDFREDKNF